jgi:hypothetical protein
MIRLIVIAFTAASSLHTTATADPKQDAFTPAPARETAARPAKRIIGGTDADEGEYPWMVALVLSDTADNFQAQVCAGSLIHPYWVLTAAHCLLGETLDSLQVLVGVTDLSDPVNARRIDIVEIIRHPDYNDFTSDSDLLLLRLAEPAAASIPFPRIIDDPALHAPGIDAQVIGWGSLTPDPTSFPKILQEAVVPIVSVATALTSIYYPAGSITTNMLPAGYAAGGIDACSGDSGGPLFVADPLSMNWVLVGITSFGEGDCGDPGVYGIYTRLLNFRNWILGYVSPGYTAWEVAEGVQGKLRDIDGDLRNHETEFRFNLSPHTDEANEIRDASTIGPALDRSFALTMERPVQHDGTRYFIEASPSWIPFDLEPLIETRTLFGPNNSTERLLVRMPEAINVVGGIGFARLSARPGTSLIVATRALHFPGYAAHTLTAEDLSGGDIFKEYILSDLPTGQAVTLTLRSDDIDARLELINDQTGQVLKTANNDSGGGQDESITFTPNGSTSFRVRVCSRTQTEQGTYTLAAFRPNTSLPLLPLPGNLSGSLSLTDTTDPNYPVVPYYKDDYRLRMDASISPVEINQSSAIIDSYLYIINAETGEVEFHDDDGGGGLNSRVTFSPRDGVLYYVRAGSAVVGETGAYTLSTQAAAPPPSITCPQIIFGMLSNTDPIDPNSGGVHYVDDYELVGVGGGQILVVTLTTAAFDAYLQIIDGDSQAILFENDDFSGTNSAISFTTQAGQSYIIRASSFGIAETGSYTLQVQ